jgi:hypothetical protein
MQHQHQFRASARIKQSGIYYAPAEHGRVRQYATMDKYDIPRKGKN